MIDWTRMARPRHDGYDTAVLLHLLEEDPAPWHSPPPHAPRAAGPTIAEGAVTVAIDPDPLLPAPRFRPLSGVPANLARAVTLVGRWPEAAAQWPRIVHTIEPFADTAWDDAAGTATSPRLGSASHNQASRFGSIGLTVDCALGAAQAIVHETAHHKLRAMGVDNERATRMILNPPEALFHSPIVGRARPMTAVLHAQYSFIHVLQLDLNMLEQEQDDTQKHSITTLIRRNLCRMIEGSTVLRSAAQLDSTGEQFMQGFFEWMDDVFQRSKNILESLQPQPASL